MFSNIAASIAGRIAAVSACVSRQRETNFNTFCNPIISTPTGIFIGQV
jgi:hypothetical protein